MCLIVFGLQATKEYPLIVAANRDEFYERPATPIHYWKEKNMIAGKDEEKGGTWLGMTPNGKFAAVTNVRNPREKKGFLSRGELVTGYLDSDHPDETLTQYQVNGHNYSGFNLIAGDWRRIVYTTNQRNDLTCELTAGIYGLSNASLNTPWPKVQKAKQEFQNIITSYKDEPNIELLFDMLSNRDKGRDEELPDTGIGKELEYQLSSLFIDIENYGTRAQTVLLVRYDGEVTMEERAFGQGGRFLQRNRMNWNIYDYS